MERCSSMKMQFKQWDFSPLPTDTLGRQKFKWLKTLYAGRNKGKWLLFNIIGRTINHSNLLGKYLDFKNIPLGFWPSLLVTSLFRGFLSYTHTSDKLSFLYLIWACCLVSVKTQIRSDQISRSVASDSLRPHESQHWCNKHKLGQTPGDGEGQGGLACCSPWGHKQWDTTWWLNYNQPSRNQNVILRRASQSQMYCCLMFIHRKPCMGSMQ